MSTLQCPLFPTHIRVTGMYRMYISMFPFGFQVHAGNSRTLFRLQVDPSPQDKFSVQSYRMSGHSRLHQVQNVLAVYILQLHSFSKHFCGSTGQKYDLELA